MGFGRSSGSPPSGLIPRTNNSSLGLGATGGPRGFAAGITQVLVNFLVNYNRGNLQQLAQDVKKFEAERIAANATLTRATERVEQMEKRVNAAQKARKDIGKQYQTTLNEIATKQAQINSLTQKDAALAAQAKAQRDLLVRNIAAATGLSEQQVRQAANLLSLESQLASAEQRRVGAAQQYAAAQERATAAMQAQQVLSQLGSAAVSRTGSLLLGLVGGTLGGALVSGAILGPLQSAMEALSSGLQDIIDPARHAREQLKDINSEIDDLTDSGRLSRLDAAVKHIQQLGSVGEGRGISPQALAQAAALSGIADRVDDLNRDLEVMAHLDELVSQGASKLAAAWAKAEVQGRNLDEVIREIAAGELLDTDTHLNYVKALQGDAFALQTLAAAGSVWAQNLLAQAGATVQAELGLTGLAGSADQTAEALERAAQAARDLDDALNQAAVGAALEARLSQLNAELDATINSINSAANLDIDAIGANYEQRVRNAEAGSELRIRRLQKQLDDLELQPSARTNSLERRLDALKDSGPSKRTNELANAIEAVNKAQERRQFREQLGNIAEQRQQILLRERLRLSNEQINLDDFKGKDRLIAIDALLARMQKQNEAQERFNKLLDIQYQISQGVRRQQGETISDFVQRRAQYYRGLLQQAADLRRQGPEADLQAEKQRVETSIELKELEERRKQLLADRARKQFLASLQEQLRASQERDRKELESRREALQKQLEASRKADQQALESRRKAIQQSIQAERDATRDRIEALQDARDRAINAREEERDAAIAAARAVVERTIAAERARADQIEKWASYAESQRLIEAMNGATSFAQLQRFAGGLAGAGFSLEYLRAQMTALGVDQRTQELTLANVQQMLNAYHRNVTNFVQDRPRTPGLPGGWAQGGAFLLNNGNTPLSGNMRWGDGQGDELGVVLSNKVLQTLRDTNGPAGKALIGGDMIIQSSEDPYRARYKWRQEVRDMVREELN